MKLTEILVVVISSCCVFVRMTKCTEREFPSRGPVRRSNFERSGSAQKAADIFRDQETEYRLEAIFDRIEEKLEKFENFEEKIVNILTRLERLEEKIDKIDDKLFNEKISDEAKLSISTRLVFWFSEFDRKIDKLIINQHDKTFDDSKSQATDQALHLELTENVRPLDIETVAQQLKESLESFGEKVQQNFSENGEKLEYLKRYLQVMFEENVNKNNSSSDQILMQIHRKERRISDHSVLIKEILSMVKERLASEEDDDGDRSSFLPDMVSTFENMRSPNLTTPKTKTTLTSRKRKVIFPNVKYKPLKLNTSFISESLDRKNNVSQNQFIRFE